MGIKRRLMDIRKRESEYYDNQRDGSEEYIASQERLKELEEQLSEHNERVAKIIVEFVKAFGGVLLPIFGWVVITAFEKDDSIRSSLKRTIECFIPKRL